MTHFRIATVLALFLATTAFAVLEDDNPIVRVEEDWELIVKSVDTNSSAPQVTTKMSPCDDGNKYGLFLINHRQYPEFYAGGIQLQMWHHDFDVSRDTHDSEEPLANANETVKWTSAMSVSDSKLHFEIINGESQTWGEFGALKVSTPCSLGNLSGYSSTESKNNSGAPFAGNRVTSLKILKVRYIRANGDVSTDNTPKVVIDNTN